MKLTTLFQTSSAKYSSKCSLPKIRRRLARRAFKTRLPQL